MPVIVSPVLKPAAAAGVLSWTGPSTGFSPGTPCMNKHPVEHDREQEVRDRTREHDREAPPDALPIERAIELGRVDRAFAFVEHLHVAAQRKGRHRPLRLVGAEFARPQRPAEAERKAQHLDVAETRNQ